MLYFFSKSTYFCFIEEYFFLLCKASLFGLFGFTVSLSKVQILAKKASGNVPSKTMDIHFA